MKNHILTHSGEKSHRCTECEKSTQEGVDLRAHLPVQKSQTDVVCVSNSVLVQVF